ncbi:MAG TPA: PIN domain-containing protein [Isosphaeraceae bacterium]|jgi:predicted nucleic acid-binding protein|nr:PIN domain-containing protein [Isosphaeraceae bacterium]
MVLDTNVLVRHWGNSRGGTPLASFRAGDVQSWARRLIDNERTDAIVTPVYLEFVCGTGDQSELLLERAYLKAFMIVDKGKISAADWKEARRLAEWVPSSRRPRNMGDCLIRAIAHRLGYDVRTFDSGMPRH